MTKPLEGLLVIEMAQFLSGPSCGLKLADLGARVIKIERPGGGDICRTLYLSDTRVDGDSTLFHAINRNKESFAADLKNPTDASKVQALIAKSDVLIQNFRPDVAERLGFGPHDLRTRHPSLIVGTISGYGEDGPWATLPGQDLLAQALSGTMWLSGSADDGPVPFGLSIGDMLAGHILTEGILAALVRRGISGQGAQVQTSLLEALVDLQFEVLTTHLNDGGRPPPRAIANGAHAYLGAPYGVYATRDGWLALAMTPLRELGSLLGNSIESLDPFRDRARAAAEIAAILATESTGHWIDHLRPHDVWCAPVLDWPAMLEADAFERLDMTTSISRGGHQIPTTRSPIRLDGKRYNSELPAPTVGQHTASICREFHL